MKWHRSARAKAEVHHQPRVTLVSGGGGGSYTEVLRKEVFSTASATPFSI